MDTFSSDISRLINTMYEGSGERRDAFETLKSLQTAEGTAALLRLAEDYRVPPFYPEILHELGQRDALDPMPYFCDILLNESNEKTHTGNQLTTIIMLSDYGHQAETLDLLTHTLKNHPSRYVLRQCVYTLGQIGTEATVYVLSLLMHASPESSVRHDAVMVLGSTGHPKAVQVLLNYLEYDHDLTDEGYPPADCVNAMNSLLRLWNADIQPFDIARWYRMLTYWLYRDTGDYPKALYTLKKLDTPEAKSIIQQWLNNRQVLSNNKFFF